MKVILTQDVRGQGKKGDLLEVSDGYARNYLLPRNLAMKATTDNMNALKLKEKAKAAQIEKEKAAAKETAEKLAGIIVTLKAKAGAGGALTWSVKSGKLPDGLSLAAKTGKITGTKKKSTTSTGKKMVSKATKSATTTITRELTRSILGNLIK